jgi:hypothetical protein
VAEYQVMFQQMKQSFPMLASGALHQMTMVRIAELRAANQLEEQREQNRKEEEERPLKTNLASKLVGMIMPVEFNTSAKHDPQDQDNYDGEIRRSSICAPWMQDRPNSGVGLHRGSTFGSRNTFGSDSIHSLWNRREPEDFINRSNSVFSLLQKSTGSAIRSDSSPSLWQNRREREDCNNISSNSFCKMLRKSAPPNLYQAPHSRSFSQLTKRTASTADVTSQFHDSHNMGFNFECRMSDKIVKEEEYDNAFGTNRRRSYNSLSSDISGLFIDEDDDEDGSENIDATDQYDDKGLYSVRSETKLPKSPDAASQCEDGKRQDKEEGKIKLLQQNDINDNKSLSSNVPQFIGLHLSKSLSSKSNESDLHHTTTMSITSELTSSDCSSTTSSNGLIVSWSDGNDLIVGFVSNRQQSENSY